jgi:hypothetical protein
MSQSDYTKNDYTIIFDEVKKYNEENSLTENDYLSSKELQLSDEIRDFIQICQELNDSERGMIYSVFS